MNLRWTKEKTPGSLETPWEGGRGSFHHQEEGFWVPRAAFSEREVSQVWPDSHGVGGTTLGQALPGLGGLQDRGGGGLVAGMSLPAMVALPHNVQL